jgi:hypothetical protein
MKKKLYLDELESFVADSAEEVRMYPSDKVWRNIDRELHGTSRWPALTFGAVLTGAIMLAALIFLQPDKDRFTVAALDHAAYTTPKTNTNSITAADELANISYNHLHQNEAKATVSENTNAIETTTNAETMVEDTEQQNLNDGLQDQNNNSETVVHVFSGINYDSNNDPERNFSLSQKDIVEITKEETAIAVLQPSANTAIAPLTSFSKPGQELLTSPSFEVPQAKAASKTSRWRLQYYAAPSLSYRLLRNEKISEKDILPNGLVPATYFTDVNTMVNHANDLGFEAGLALGYQLNDRVLVRAGVQFNYRSYQIEAFKNEVAAPAVIRLSQTAAADSLVAYSNISNRSGSQPLQMTNRFLQISIPIGIELSMIRFGKSQMVVGTSLQPTYNLNQNAWLLASDYQQYVKEPALMRNFNLNSSIEFFYRYQSKNGLQWQLGPQVRYQLLSTATKAYPVREHLIDYGIKFGVMKTLK